MNKKDQIIEDKKSEEKAAEEVDKKDDFIIPLTEAEKEDNDPRRKLAPNSKPYWTMRVAAGFIDACILLLSIIGLNQLFMLTPIGKTINNYQTQIALVMDDYKLKALVEGSEETYGHKVYDNEENYSTYTTNLYVVHDADETGHNYVVVKNDEVSEAVSKAYVASYQADTNYKNLSFDKKLVSYGMTMLSGFIAEGIFLLAIPLINKRRATLGKLAAGTQLIDYKYQTPPKWYQMVGRFAWQFVIESALPYLLLTNMIWIFLIVPIILFIIVLCNKKGRTLHDFISRTMVIDKRTYLPISEQ